MSDPGRRGWERESPVQAAVGEAWVAMVLERSVRALLDATLASTPHDLDEMLASLAGKTTGLAHRIRWAQRFDDPLGRSQLERAGYPPAQNCRYVKPVPPRERWPDEGVAARRKISDSR